MKTLVRLMIAGALVVSFSAASYAQMQANPPAAAGAPAAPATPAAPTAPKAKKAPMKSAKEKAKSKECLAKANEQGLHGKAKKEFRAKCKAE